MVSTACRGFRVGFVEHLNMTQAAQERVIKFVAMIVTNLVTPKAVAKTKLLFSKLASEVGLLSIKVRLKQHNKV